MGILSRWKEKRLQWEQERRAEEKRRQEALEKENKRKEEQALQRKKDLQEKKKWFANFIGAARDGKLPKIQWNVENNPFTFTKTERVLFILPSVGYTEQKVKREYAGKSAGVGIRVAKGVNLRLGQSRGTPIEYDTWVPRGHGPLAVTTKHLYFYSSRVFRIPLGKIVSAIAHNQSVLEITRDRASGLKERFQWNPHDAFKNADAEFIDELITALCGNTEPVNSREVVDIETYVPLISEAGADGFGIEAIE